jgi:hypothetical protein
MAQVELHSCHEQREPKWAKCCVGTVLATDKRLRLLTYLFWNLNSLGLEITIVNNEECLPLCFGELCINNHQPQQTTTTVLWSASNKASVLWWLMIIVGVSNLSLPEFLALPWAGKFAVRFPWGTRQRYYVSESHKPGSRHIGKARHKRSSPCAKLQAHGKEHQFAVRRSDDGRCVAFVCRVPKRHTALVFAVCVAAGTRQRWSSPSSAVPCNLCRVQLTAKPLPCALAILPCAWGTRQSSWVR